MITILLLLVTLLLGLALWRLRLKKLATYHSPLLGKIEVFQKYNLELMLTTNSYPQGISISSPSIKQSYWFKVAGEAVKFCQNKKNPKLLMLGLGANTIPNLIAKMDSKIHQTIVEIDQYIIVACRKFFALDKLPHYKLIQADAYKLLKTQDSGLKTYNVIIVDIFLGAPPYHDIKSNQPSFIKSLQPFLKKDGMIIFNRPSHNDLVRKDGEKLRNYLKTLFKTVQLFDIKDPRGYRNYVISADSKK